MPTCHDTAQQTESDETSSNEDQDEENASLGSDPNGSGGIENANPNS